MKIAFPAMFQKPAKTYAYKKGLEGYIEKLCIFGNNNCICIFFIFFNLHYLS